jgi:hypothetical protein
MGELLSWAILEMGEDGDDTIKSSIPSDFFTLLEIVGVSGGCVGQPFAMALTEAREPATLHRGSRFFPDSPPQ